MSAVVARFAATDDVVPDGKTCPPDRDLIEWVRKNVSADGAFAVDRWTAYAPQVFMPQQAVTFPALDASFVDEGRLFRDYYEFFDARMQRDRVQPFFNSVETATESSTRRGSVSRRLGSSSCEHAIRHLEGVA
jgi:hypothetical protein